MQSAKKVELAGTTEFWFGFGQCKWITTNRKALFSTSLHPTFSQKGYNWMSAHHYHGGIVGVGGKWKSDDI